ncbi:MAG: DUF2232 domain-containing protein [Ghiorsea sp.]
MNQEPEQNGKVMPKMVEFFLTKRVPCAFIVVAMLTSAYWFNVLFGEIPLLGFLFVLVGMLLHLAVPGVFALVLFGGGLAYSLQVGGIAALLILLLSSGSFYAVLIFFSLFVMVPVIAASVLQTKGLSQSAWILAVAMFVIVLVALMVGMDADGMKAFVSEQFKPMFDNMVTSLPVGETDAVESIRQLQNMMIQIFPGLLVLSFWMVWWSSILYARKYAKEYGFYQGDQSEMLQLFLPKQLVFGLLLFSALTIMADGDLQYIATNGLLVLSGLIAVQGIAVAHAWLKSRGMMNTIVVMYVMLFFWSVVVLVFMMIGLLDIWFNFRRNIVPATGGK